MRNVTQLFRKVVEIRSKPNLETIDRKLFIGCKSIKKHIKKHGLTKHLPAVIIGALLGEKYKIDYTRNITEPIAPNLRVRLEGLGEIGAHNGVNIVGKCAEVNSANYLLLRKAVPLNSILFTTGYRPRTAQKKKPCNNCVETFK